MLIFPAPDVPPSVAISTAPPIISGQSKYADSGFTVNLNESAPNDEMIAPAIVSPSVFARSVPSIMPMIKTNTEREIYCSLISDFVKPNAFIIAMDVRSFAISIFINNSVINAVKMSETTMAA